MHLTDPNMLDNLTAHISMGGSPIDWCSAHKIRYCDLTHWLSERPAEQRRYDTAMSARNEWYIQRVMLELGRIATTDIREAFAPDGSLRPVHELPAHVAAVLASVDVQSVSSDGEEQILIKKIKFWDKMKALELLGKNLMLFIDRVDHRLKGDLNIVINVKQPDITPDDISSSGAGIHGIRTSLAENN